HELSRELPESQNFSKAFAGLLAVPLTKDFADCLLWFRVELPETVTWTGDPNKPVEKDTVTPQTLHPRRSFAMWQKTLRGRSLPWRTAEVDATLAFRNSLISAELVQLNRELVESNERLDAFTDIASHDLAQPVRGIADFARFIEEDEKDKLSPASCENLTMIIQLSERVQELLHSLYQFARLGKIGLAVKQTDLNDVLADITIRLE